MMPGVSSVTEWTLERFDNIALPNTERAEPSSNNSEQIVIELEHVGSTTGSLVGIGRNSLARSSKSVFEVGDVLFGKLRAYLRKYWLADVSGLCSTEFWVLRPNKDKVRSDFLRYLVESDFFIRAAVNSYGTHMPRSDWRVVGELQVWLPPICEQEKIASVLIDTDSLIQSLNRLIAKKRAIKQGAMQQLLTGQTRLPGFSGEWQTSTLGELFEIESGKSKSSHLSDSGKYIVVDMGGISQDGALSANKRTNWDADILSAGALVMPKDDIGGGKIIGKVAHIPVSGKFVLGDHVYRLTSKGCDSKFLSYVINSETVNRELQSKVVGSAQLGLGRKSVISQRIEHPEFSEQQAIAQVLSDMDIEIEALVKQIEKTALIKIGMMQDLLTGKVRL